MIPDLKLLMQEISMVSDLKLFFRRVMEHALAKSPTLEAALMHQDKEESEAYLAEVLGTRLAEMFERDEPSEPAGIEGSNRNFSPELIAHYEELLARNTTLALALGACDCWGELEDCDVCRGAGAPGWTAPDQQLFSQLIQPVLRVLKASSFKRVAMPKNRVSKP